MKKTKLSVIIALVIGTISMMSFDIMDDTGRAGRTGSPSEQTCVACHTGAPVNDGNGSVVITSNNMTNWEYMPGDTYNIDVTVSRTGALVFGFGLECLTNVAVPQNAGTLLVTNSAQTQILLATINTVSRKNMTHKLNSGLVNDTKTFSFKWIAPTTNVGNVTMYCAGNAANHNGTKLGDYIYTTSQVITPAFGAGINDQQGVEDAFSFFPNPASNFVNVNFNAAAGEMVSFTLTSLEGKQVGPLYTFRGTGSAQSSAIELPSDLARGIYLLKMENANVVTVKRVCVE